MANETVGSITCHYCDCQADVRRNARDKLYINCGTCGIIQPTKPRFQQYIEENATMYGSPEANDEGRKVGGGEPEPEKAIEKVEPVAAEEKPKEKSFFSWLTDDEEEQEA